MATPEQLAYCTNVHAGSDLDGMWENLRRHSLAVKARFAPREPMGVGLWVAAPAADQLLASPRLVAFSAWLAQHQLIPFTLNGFPYGDFHDAVVKQRVYHPTWMDRERRDYTLQLVKILHEILPENKAGSISTLPIAWRSPRLGHGDLRIAARHLRDVAGRLSELESETGRLISLCLEPEPGCVLQRCDDVVSFFEQYLFCGGDERACRRYLRVCHDICHSAVMFEDQHQVLTQYAQRGILVGKVQVSSAVEVDFDHTEPCQRQWSIEALSSFAEDRYLHQTAIRPRSDGHVTFFDDLPQALAAARENPRLMSGQWRVHFHVPIFVEQSDRIATTQSAICQCLQAGILRPQLTHFEVETYAWNVLPPPLRCRELADGIAREMSWLRDQLMALPGEQGE